MKKIEILIVVIILLALAVLTGCKDEEPETPNDAICEPNIVDRYEKAVGGLVDTIIEADKILNTPKIDPNSELVTALNLLYDPNFYTTEKIVCDKIITLQFVLSDVNSLSEAASSLREFYCGNSKAKEVIDIEVTINNKTHTASFEDFFEWMGFKRKVESSLKFYYWYEWPLKKAGVTEEDFQDCIRWAVGDDYFSLKQLYFNDRWNERHPDLFILCDSDDRNEAFYKVGKAWITKQEQN